MRLFSTSIFFSVSIAASGSAEATTPPPTWVTNPNSETTTAVSGEKGSTVRHFPLGQGDANALKSIEVREIGDRPCKIKLDYGALPLGDGAYAADGNLEQGCPSTALSLTPDPGVARLKADGRYARGVQVCLNKDRDRIKGVMLFAAKVDDAGKVTDVSGDPPQFELANCDKWYATAYCPDQAVAVGVVGHYTSTDGFKGLALVCRYLMRYGTVLRPQ